MEGRVSDREEEGQLPVLAIPPFAAIQEQHYLFEK